MNARFVVRAASDAEYTDPGALAPGSTGLTRWAAVTEDDGCYAFPDPAHDRNRHRVAECFVARPIRCRFAAVLDQRVIVGESLQTQTLDRHKATNASLRDCFWHAVNRMGNFLLYADTIRAGLRRSEGNSRDMRIANGRRQVFFTNASSRRAAT